MSKRNLQRALRIERNLTDSMKELYAKAAEIREKFLEKVEIGETNMILKPKQGLKKLQAKIVVKTKK